jgi:hypothetical protein
MSFRYSHSLKRLLGRTVALLIAGLGVLGVVVSLFPPHHPHPDILTRLLGLVFSASFFLAAWVVWRWTHSCLACSTERQRH